MRIKSSAPGTLRRRLPSYLKTLRTIQSRRPLANARVFEVGTGWCPIAPVLLHLAGAQSIRSVDHVPHLRWALVCNVLDACTGAVEEISSALGIASEVIRS